MTVYRHLGDSYRIGDRVVQTSTGKRGRVCQVPAYEFYVRVRWDGGKGVNMASNVPLNDVALEIN